MPTIIRTMLVEDNRDYRSVIEHALEVEPDIELISQFSTPEIALRSLEDHKTRKVADLILLDLRLPGMDGLEALPWFQKALPDAKVIILTQSDAEADILKAIKLGAAGYLLKSTRADQLIDGIRNVMSGGASLETGVARLIIETLQTKLPDSEPKELLSKREFEILTLLAEGLVKKKICEQLNLSYSTVDTHVAHIYNKLNASNAPAAVSRAYKLGLFSRDS
jgi:DNA-binding NarL/FixJ family response regulator